MPASVVSLETKLQLGSCVFLPFLQQEHPHLAIYLLFSQQYKVSLPQSVPSCIGSLVPSAPKVCPPCIGSLVASSVPATSNVFICRNKPTATRHPTQFLTTAPPKQIWEFLNEHPFGAWPHCSTVRTRLLWIVFSAVIYEQIQHLYLGQ